MYILKNWSMQKDFCGYYATGDVYHNPRFVDSSSINTSTILRIKEIASGYVICTFNSRYFLAKDSCCNIMNGIEAAKRILRETEKAYHCAEKLLAEGDCLFFENIVFYRTSKGIVKLLPKRSFYRIIRYSYNEDDFELELFSDNFYSVRCGEKFRDGALFEISFNYGILKKMDYREFYINKCRHRLYQEAMIDEWALPF